MSLLDVSQAQPITSSEEFDHWVREHGADERELIVAIYKKASGKQTVTFDELLETSLCHGWVDTQTKSIDDERYAIRFVPPRIELVGDQPRDRAAAGAGGANDGGWGGSAAGGFVRVG